MLETIQASGVCPTLLALIPYRWRLVFVYCFTLASMLIVASIPTEYVSAQERETQRAKLPTWKRLPPGVFFDDAFAKGLRGTRPATIGAPVVTSTNPPANANTDSPEPVGGNAWSTWITSASIEDELKAIHRRCTSSLRTEGHFRGRGSREIRPHFGTAAFLFAIIENYDADVRWKHSATPARKLFLQATNNMRRPNSQSYREAQQRQQELFDLIRGGRLEAKGKAELDWSQVADRRLMMRRLDISLKESISPGTASASELESQESQLIREAELTAAIAHVLTKDVMDDAGDEEYDSLCNELKMAARDLVRAVKDKQLDAAQEAEGVIKRSCDTCHETYRG